GWMGPHCAACHDRAEEGAASLIPAGDPARTLLVGHATWVGQVFFTPDGRTVLSGDRCGSKVLAWDLATGTAREEGSGREEVFAVALAPNGQTLAVGFSSGKVVLFSLKDGMQQRGFTTGNGRDRVLDLAFSPDGTLLAVAPYGSVVLCDLTVPDGRTLVAEN